MTVCNQPGFVAGSLRLKGGSTGLVNREENESTGHFGLAQNKTRKDFFQHSLTLHGCWTAWHEGTEKFYFCVWTSSKWSFKRFEEDFRSSNTIMYLLLAFLMCLLYISLWKLLEDKSFFSTVTGGTGMWYMKQNQFCS